MSGKCEEHLAGGVGAAGVERVGIAEGSGVQGVGVPLVGLADAKFKVVGGEPYKVTNLDVEGWVEAWQTPRAEREQ